MQHRADFELVRRAAGAEPPGLETLFEDTFARVYTFVARRSPGREAAERVTQRVLERVFGELRGYDGRVSFSAWVLRFVKHELARATPGQTAAASRPGTRSASGPSARARRSVATCAPKLRPSLSRTRREA
jgi:DNA-directed RNA polymerase specialized sigma24 family protein